MTAPCVISVFFGGAYCTPALFVLVGSGMWGALFNLPATSERRVQEYFAVCAKKSRFMVPADLMERT